MPDAAICDACRQQHIHAPTRCFTCEQPIFIGQAFERDIIRGVCTPRHRDCLTKQGALL